MKASFALILLAGLMVSGCSQHDINAMAVKANMPATLHVESSVALSPAEHKAIEEAVRKALKDPTSATFGNKIAGRNAQGKVLFCGLVNARNSFGGYAGMQPYLGEFGPSGATATLNASPAIRYEMCRQQGLEIIS